jgi:C4-dicarboxylate-specific signal transduction histidine kinase
LSRIFGHLIQNAAEALRDVQFPSIAISLTDSKERVVVAVSDNGSGMSESFIKDKLFRPFSSTKQTGMGIGVFESANYLREIGGTISVSSALEKGTRFEISLARAVTVS